MACKSCNRERALVDELCDDCTIALHGCLFPWLEPEKDRLQMAPEKLMQVALKRLISNGPAIVTILQREGYCWGLVQQVRCDIEVIQSLQGVKEAANDQKTP